MANFDFNDSTRVSLDDVESQQISIDDRFRRCLLGLSYLAESEGIEILPFEDYDLPLFTKLPESDQTVLLRTVERYYEVMVEVKNEDRFLTKNPNTLWRILGRMRMRSCTDLFESLQSGDVIEIYDLNGRQLFRSIDFFSVCSYT